VAGGRRAHLQARAAARALGARAAVRGGVGGAGSVRRSFGARRRGGVGARCTWARTARARCGGSGGAAAAAWGHGLGQRGGVASRTSGGGGWPRKSATATLQPMSIIFFLHILEFDKTLNMKSV
jgi:hypothetical protein